LSRDPDRGVVLINVLVVLGLAASVVYLMLSLADLGVARSQRFGEAGQALALIRAGERSASLALRRDMMVAPDIDYAGEAWATATQRTVSIEGGSFALRLSDAQGLFNLNRLPGAGLQGEQALRAILGKLELPPELAARIVASVTRDGPLRELGDLIPRAGIAPGDVARLRSLVTALPGQGDVNVNAAPLELLGILLQNQVQARVLTARRERAGFLTPEDVTAAGIILPRGVGFTSDLYHAQVAVRIGGTLQVMESLLQRRSGRDDVPEVVVVGRRNATAAVSPPPPSSSSSS
jgi:general secretion pathway protein K